jgi:hypothetical protein
MKMKKLLCLLFAVCVTFITGKKMAYGAGAQSVPTVCSSTTIKTVCASGCDYTTIQAAVNAAQPGWTIQVKNGIYTSGGQDTSVVNIISKSGTSSNPICLQNYPGHNPVIDPTGGTVTQSANQKGINIYNSRWWIIEGFEIRHGWEGIKIQPPSTDLSQVSSNITIRNNYIHDNNFAGITPHNATDIYIAYNKITSNGDDTNECTGAGGSQCHNLYIKTNPNYPGIAQKTTIRGNFIQLSSGGAIHIYDRATDILIENNLIIVDGKWGIIAPMDNSVVRNNTIVLSNPPLINNGQNDYVLIDFRYGASTLSNNKIFNNIFYTNGSSFNSKTVFMIATPDNPNLSTWTVNYNLWYAPPNTRWIWKGTVRTDFNSQYKATTGWDANGPSIPTDPLFVNLSLGDFHIQSTSPARNAGTNLECPITDYDGQSRPQESICDIGMDEFVAAPPPPTFSVQDIKWLNLSNCGSPESATPLTTINKATTYCLCVKATHSGGHDANVSTIRYLIKNANYNLPAGQSLVNGNVVPYKDKLMRIAFNFSSTGSQALGAYITEGSTTGAFVGNTDWTWGTNGGGLDATGGSTGFYESSGRISVNSNTKWHCTKLKLPDEFLVGGAEDQALLKTVDGSLSSLYTEQSVTVAVSSPDGPPTLTIDRFNSTVISGCLTNEYIFSDGANPSLRISFSPQGTRTIQNVYWRCLSGCTQGQTPLVTTSPVTFTPNLKEGKNEIEIIVVDNANNTATTTCKIEKRKFILFRIGN